MRANTQPERSKRNAKSQRPAPPLYSCATHSKSRKLPCVAPTCIIRRPQLRYRRRSTRSSQSRTAHCYFDFGWDGHRRPARLKSTHAGRLHTASSASATPCSWDSPPRPLAAAATPSSRRSRPVSELVPGAPVGARKVRPQGPLHILAVEVVHVRDTPVVRDAVELEELHLVVDLEAPVRELLRAGEGVLRRHRAQGVLGLLADHVRGSLEVREARRREALDLRPRHGAEHPVREVRSVEQPAEREQRHALPLDRLAQARALP